MKKIIFLCTGNSCRSQMAEGFARNILRDKQSLIDSAGIRPEGLNSLTVQVMKEVGVDISSQKSNSIQDIDLKLFDTIVTVCDHAYQRCPVVQHTNIIHKSFLDPALASGSLDDQLKVYRRVRDEIRAMVSNLLGK